MKGYWAVRNLADPDLLMPVIDRAGQSWIVYLQGTAFLIALVGSRPVPVDEDIWLDLCDKQAA